MLSNVITPVAVSPELAIEAPVTSELAAVATTVFHKYNLAEAIILFIEEPVADKSPEISNLTVSTSIFSLVAIVSIE
jgi:hypothetical protein